MFATRLVEEGEAGLDEWVISAGSVGAFHQSLSSKGELELSKGNELLANAR